MVQMDKFNRALAIGYHIAKDLGVSPSSITRLRDKVVKLNDWENKRHLVHRDQPPALFQPVHLHAGEDYGFPGSQCRFHEVLNAPEGSIDM